MRRCLVALAAVATVTGCGGRAYSSTDGARLVSFTLQSRDVNRSLDELLVVPARHGRTLLVLMHGKGAPPSSWLSQSFFDELKRLGRRAPQVLLLDGGSDSFWHDRDDGRWGSMVLHEGIPAGLRRTRAKRVAIGGISMGGFGALDLGAQGRFCAVGAHSPALWRRPGDTAPGAFDDAADFAHHDLVAHPPLYRAPVWIDVGASDPFHDTDVAFARKARGNVELHVWRGDHDWPYWRAHIGAYLDFYARSCE